MSLIDEMKEHYAEIPTMVTIHDYQERRLSLFVRAMGELEQADKMREALQGLVNEVIDCGQPNEWEYFAKAQEALQQGVTK